MVNVQIENNKVQQFFSKYLQSNRLEEKIRHINTKQNTSKSKKSTNKNKDKKNTEKKN